MLIDEYDKPLLQALDNGELLDEYCNTLKAFYGVLKSTDRYLRFVLLTGVTKFAQDSVFKPTERYQPRFCVLYHMWNHERRTYNNFCIRIEATIENKRYEPRKSNGNNVPEI